MPREERSPRERLGREIATTMGGLVRRFRAAFVACADELGLGPSEAQLIWLLDEAGDASTGDLARRLGVDPANASTLLTKLERRGLVRRVPAERDRRRRLVSLTDEGREAKATLTRCIGSRQPGFGQLTTAELVSFRDLLRRVAGDD
ncbi:MAG TPA: MarR family transcriptional regulator [Solirubrobacterales bacterium]|jgi:DNA-binding MarR family transcriptional regulator